MDRRGLEPARSRPLCYSSIITDPVAAPRSGYRSGDHHPLAVAAARDDTVQPRSGETGSENGLRRQRRQSAQHVAARRQSRPSGAGVLQPIASNIVNMTDPVRASTMVGATASSTAGAGISGTAYGDWDPATLLAAPITTLSPHQRRRASRSWSEANSRTSELLPGRDSIAPSSTIAAPMQRPAAVGSLRHSGSRRRHATLRLALPGHETVISAAQRSVGTKEV